MNICTKIMAIACLAGVFGSVGSVQAMGRAGGWARGAWEAGYAGKTFGALCSTAAAGTVAGYALLPTIIVQQEETVQNYVAECEQGNNPERPMAMDGIAKMFCLQNSLSGYESDFADTELDMLSTAGLWGMAAGLSGVPTIDVGYNAPFGSYGLTMLNKVMYGDPVNQMIFAAHGQPHFADTLKKIVAVGGHECQHVRQKVSKRSSHAFLGAALASESARIALRFALRPIMRRVTRRPFNPNFLSRALRIVGIAPRIAVPMAYQNSFKTELEIDADMQMAKRFGPEYARALADFMDDIEIVDENFTKNYPEWMYRLINAHPKHATRAAYLRAWADKAEAEGYDPCEFDTPEQAFYREKLNEVMAAIEEGCPAPFGDNSVRYGRRRIIQRSN